MSAAPAPLPPYETLAIRRDGAVDRVTLNRPAKLNAVTRQMVDELDDYFGRLQFAEEIRIVVLRGAGRAFCVGLDMNAWDPSQKRTVEETLLFQRRLAEIVLRMRRCPQAIIALVNGVACGAGFAMALAADIRIATPAARMNAAFIRIGASACDVGVSYFLPRLVGASVAFELMMTGRFIDAERALRTGLVSEVVPEDALEAAGDKLIEEMLTTSPLGLRLTKQGLSAAIDAPNLEAAIEMENRNQILCGASGALEEGMKAFLEKRRPTYAGG